MAVWSRNPTKMLLSRFISWQMNHIEWSSNIGWCYLVTNRARTALEYINGYVRTSAGVIKQNLSHVRSFLVKKAVSRHNLQHPYTLTLIQEKCVSVLRLPLKEALLKPILWISAEARRIKLPLNLVWRKLSTRWKPSLKSFWSGGFWQCDFSP